MSEHLDLRTRIGRETVDRRAVLAWEAGRARRVLRQLGGRARPTDDVDELRERLLALKEDIGPAELERRLTGRLRASTLVSRALTAGSGPARAASSIRIRVPGGRATHLVDWFGTQFALPSSPAMLAACPAHYLIGDEPDGRQKVIETTGGSPLPARFRIRYGDLTGLRMTADPGYPLQVAGVARDDAGTPIGGVRHQFRDVGDGFEAWLTVEFPRLTPGHMIRRHRWHLACEFGNWIEFAARDTSQ